MKKHVFFLVAVLLIAVMASPAWAGQKHKKAAWQPGVYRVLCHGRHELAAKSPRAFRGLLMAAMRSPVLRLLCVQPDPGGKTDPGNDKKNPGATPK
jgi:hypothetical protein